MYGRQRVPRAVVREIGVGFRGEVRLVELEQGRLDVEAPVPGVQAEDPGSRGLAQRMLAERVLDRGEAFVGSEEPLHVAPRQQKRAGFTR